MKEKYFEYFKKEEESPEEIQEKLKNPEYLPSIKEMLKAFCGKEKEWRKFCRGEVDGHEGENYIYEFLNKEFISALGNYLAAKIKDIKKSKDEEIIILEVGAGNGRLSHFLKKELEKAIQEKKTKIITTDSGKLKTKSYFPVEKISQNDALKKYRPQIVIVSWMPCGKDWTADFRNTKSIEEYILIGETDGGCCGEDWRTWGYPYPLEYEGKIPPYEVDNFSRKDLKEISKYQICRTDDIEKISNPEFISESKTVSFKRK